MGGDSKAIMSRRRRNTSIDYTFNDKSNNQACISSSNQNIYHSTSRIRRRSEEKNQSMKVHFESNYYSENQDEDNISYSNTNNDNTNTNTNDDNDIECDNDYDLEENVSCSSSSLSSSSSSASSTASQQSSPNEIITPLIPPPPPPPFPAIPESTVTAVAGNRSWERGIHIIRKEDKDKRKYSTENNIVINNSNVREYRHQYMINNDHVGDDEDNDIGNDNGNVDEFININHNNDDDNENDNNLTISDGANEFLLETEKQQLPPKWKLKFVFRIRNPLFLLLVVGVSLLGFGLYTQSYTTLSIVLNQVTASTQERQKNVFDHFDNIERDIRNFEQQLLEIDPGALFIISSSNIDDDGATITGNDDPNKHKLALTNKKNDNSGTIEVVEPLDDESGMFDELVDMQEKLRMSNSKMSSLQKYVQATSLRDATRKYGTGIIRVELELEFPEDRKKKIEATTTVTTTSAGSGSSSNKSNGSNANANGSHSDSSSSNILILEMAPLDLMPHSVFTFLEMVDSKLFDGCSFILHAMNVVKAAPLPYDGSSASQKVKAFARLGLDTVSFREYSPNYPHEMYTVGFAADGSPSFYINTNNNTDQHVGEPCFARIISGFDTVERMKTEPTRNGMWYRKRIGIKRVTIL